MQGEKFVKLFEVEGADVLYYKTFESISVDEDKYEIKGMVSFKGATISVTLGFDNDEVKRNNEFENLSQEKAEAFYNTIKEMFE